MEWLAASLFICTVLFLVDKNQAWPKFWRFTKWASMLVFLIVIGLGSYYAYQQHEANKPVTLDMSHAQPIDYDALAAKHGGKAISDCPSNH